MNKLPVIVCVTVAGIAAICGKLICDRRKSDHTGIVQFTSDAEHI